MLIFLLSFLLISNALSLTKDKSILFSRIVMVSLILTSFLAFNNLFVLTLGKGIGLYGGLFHVTPFTQSFNIFIFLISATILTLTSFYPRRLYLKEYSSSLTDLLFSKITYNKTKLSNKMGEQFRILEYSLIIVFVLSGAVFLMSASDLVSIFLAIELQSYGLHIIALCIMLVMYQYRYTVQAFLILLTLNPFLLVSVSISASAEVAFY
jgi:NADH-ubiquinone oxidoreductase chain 2